jgi:hypothetical protein
MGEKEYNDANNDSIGVLRNWSHMGHLLLLAYSNHQGLSVVQLHHLVRY